jgi:hypothetical protein
MSLDAQDGVASRPGDEFKKLRDDEVASIEVIVSDVFEGFDAEPFAAHTPRCP